GDPSVERHAHVDRDDVARLQAVGAWDAVHDHRVRRGADRPWEAAVALERRHRPARADEALGDLVELLCADAGGDARLELLERRHQDRAGARHLLDLLGGLLDDHPGSLAGAPGRAPTRRSPGASWAGLRPADGPDAG